MRPILLILAVALAAAQPQPSPDVVTIEGRVLRANTNQPIDGARVALRRNDNREGSITRGVWEAEVSGAEYDPDSDVIVVLSDENGIFRFRITSPADFFLFTQREGFVRTVSGSMAPRFQVEAGEGRDDIVIELTPEGSIGGRIVDAETGDPVAGLGVWVRRYYSWSSGDGRSLRPAGNPSTSGEDGGFRIEGLGPGDYYIQVTGARSVLLDPTPVDDFAHAVNMNYPPTWYPGVEIVEQAISVSLLEGGELSNVDFEVERRPMASVRARVAGGDENVDAEIVLTKIETALGSRSYSGMAYGTRNVGEVFQVDNLAPGRYWFHAEVAGDDPGGMLQASYVFDVGESNIDTIDLPLRRGVEITGVVRLDGYEPGPDEPMLPTDDTTVSLWPLFRSGLLSDERQPQPANPTDGSFLKQGVVIDDYLVNVARRPAGYQISEVLYNESVANCRWISLSPEANQHRLDVTLAPAHASVEAVISDGIRPSPAAVALLIPECGNSRTPVEVLERTLIRATAAEDGRATITGLLPGTYRAIAYPGGSLWREDPSLLSRLLNGEEISVGNGATFIQLRTQPAP